MKTSYFIEKINWLELHNQKRLLLETINNDAVSPEHKEALEDILSLIDATQDYAVDEMGIDEAIVFETDGDESTVLYDMEQTKTKTVIERIKSRD